MGEFFATATAGDYLFAAVFAIVVVIGGAAAATLTSALIWKVLDWVSLWRLRRDLEKYERRQKIPRVMRERRL